MDSDGSRVKIFIAVMVALFLIRALYSACEYALVEVNDSKVKTLAEKNKKYEKLLNVISKPRELITTFAVHRVLSCVIITVSAVVGLSGMIEEKLGGSMNTNAAAVLTYILIILGMSLIIYVFADLFPKRIAGKHAEKTALKMVTPFCILKNIMMPFSAISVGLGFVLGKLFGFSVKPADDVVTEEEILMMVEAGNETGVIEESQREMINNIFEFDDTVVSDVMTHRTDIVGVGADDKIGDVVYLGINEGFSRLPVYEESVDNIIGILNVKDLLCLVGCEHSEDFNIRQFMRKAEFVPETAKCKDVLKEMTLKKTQMMVIADEYGGTSGIVTMEDLLEEIVGNIQDEYDDDEADIAEIDDGVYTIDGSADPDDIFPKLGIELPEGHNYDTMSAFVVDRLGRIPSDDEKAEIQYENVIFTVLLIEDNWISKLKAVVLKDE